MLQTKNHVVDDAIAILHDGSAYLHVAATQLDELQRVAPCFDAADAAVLHALHDGILDHGQDVAQGDGLDSTARETRTRLASVHFGTLAQGYALDGVDGRYGIRPREVGTHGWVADVGDVGRHLGDDGDGDVTLDVGGEEGDQLGVLPYVAAHAGHAHLGA